MYFLRQGVATILRFDELHVRLSRFRSLLWAGSCTLSGVRCAASSRAVRRDERSFTILARPRPYALAAGAYAIEPDASAASYFLALPLVTGGQLTLLGAQDAQRGLQGDTAFADVVRAVGATVSAMALSGRR